jgi:hypothetical protein
VVGEQDQGSQGPVDEPFVAQAARRVGGPPGEPLVARVVGAAIQVLQGPEQARTGGVGGGRQRLRTGLGLLGLRDG